MLNAKKSGFTLVEVVIACSIFAIVVVGIILAINRSFAFMNNTKLSIRATNFAREGVEMMYNIRDSNWRRQSGERDKYWLNVGKLEVGTDGKYTLKADDDHSFAPGIYVLNEGQIKEKVNGTSIIQNKYIYAEELKNNGSKLVSSNVEEFYSDDGFWEDKYEGYRKNAMFGFTGTYSYYELGESGQEPKMGNIQDLLVENGLEFYRIVRVFGIYKKDGEHTSHNTLASDTEKGNGTPAEMRFCVKVFYRGNGKHSSELCSIMTNFME